MNKSIAAITFATILIISGCCNCGDFFIDQRDGKEYKVIKIGSQTWMAENLNYQPPSGNSCCYDDSPDNCDKYGRLYDWKTAKEACPPGWHLPNNAEWDKLYRFADSTNGTESPYKSKTAGKYLKATNGWNNNGNGKDDFGFSALPGGSYYYPIGIFSNVGTFGIWWASEDDSGGNIYYRMMYYSSESADELNQDVKSFGYSVRCVKD
jgi:uncharacterized protein (TIGR02145 family)